MYFSFVQKNAISLVATYSIAGILLCLVHTYGIWSAGFFDYDSARNWQVVQEISRGNFRNLFQHASPTFFLFYATFTLLFKDFHYYLIINSLFNVGAVLLLVRFISRYISFTAAETALLILFTGCSTFMVASSRYFTIEAPSLFLFILFLGTYFKRLNQLSQRALWQAATILAVGLTINYKFLLVLPVAFVLEILHRDRVFTLRNYTFVALILLSPYLIYAVVATAVDLPFYRFPAAFIKINDFTTPTPGLRTGRFDFELFYYLKYLWHFESPLILAGILLFPILFRQFIFTNIVNSPITVYRYLFFILFLFLGGMHLLLKSPRGLLFSYALLYLISYLSLKKLSGNQLITILLLAGSVVYQIRLLQKEIYTYTPTHYPQVVKFLQDRKITKLATTVGLGITPFAASAGIEVATVFDEKNLPYLKKQGYTHVLLDDDYLVANIRNFTRLEKSTPLASWPEPSLLSLFLYLDQCEFTGLSYAQALQEQQAAERDSIQLRLLRME